MQRLAKYRSSFLPCCYSYQQTVVGSAWILVVHDTAAPPRGCNMYYSYRVCKEENIFDAFVLAKVSTKFRSILVGEYSVYVASVERTAVYYINNLE